MVGNIRKILDTFHDSEEILLGKDNARALIDFVEETAKKLGMRPPPVYRLTHDLPMAHATFITVNGKADEVVHITDGALKQVFGSPDLHVHVPDGLKAVIGHEMSHIKEGLEWTKMKRVPLFAFPAAALVGYELYKEAGKRHAQHPEKNVRMHLDAITEEEKKRAAAKGRAKGEGGLLEWGRRMALDAGIIAGGLTSRQMALNSEYCADRAGVMASGNPEAFIESLAKFHKQIDEYTKPLLKEWSEGFAKRAFMDNVKQLAYLMKQSAAELTYSAHPSNAARLRAIRQFAKESGLIAARVL